MPDPKTWLRPIAELQAPDVWPEALQHRVEHGSRAPKPHRRHLKTIAIFVAAALCIGLALYGLAGLDTDRSEPSGLPPGDWSTFTKPAGVPITVQYPTDWYAAAAKSPPPTQIGGVVSAEGLVTSNTKDAVPSIKQPGQASYVPTNLDLPNTFVTVSILQPEGWTGGPPLSDSPFPLSMADAKDASRGDENVQYLNAVVGGKPFWITIRAGSDASSDDLSRADAIVGSIRPTPDAAPTTDFPAVNDGRTFASGIDLLPPIVRQMAPNEADSEACASGDGSFSIVDAAVATLGYWKSMSPRDADVAASAGVVVIPPTSQDSNHIVFAGPSASLVPGIPVPLFWSDSDLVYAVFLTGSCSDGSPVSVRVIFNARGELVSVLSRQGTVALDTKDPFG